MVSCWLNLLPLLGARHPLVGGLDRFRVVQLAVVEAKWGLPPPRPRGSKPPEGS